MSDLSTLVQDLTINSIDESSFTNEELALKSQWETLSPSANEFLPQLNDSLRSKTYLSGSKPSSVDASVFKIVFPLASLWTSIDDLSKNRHIIRWCDLVQNTLVNVPSDSKLKIDYSVKLPREFKQKKKKDEVAKQEKIQAQKEAAPVLKEQKLQAKKEGLDEEAKKLAKEAKEAKKLAKAKAKAEADAKVKSSEVAPNPSQIDFRVGYIEKAIAHPNADSLYVSTIQMGDEEGPRTVCSGLVKYFTLEQMQGRYVVTIANLKPVTMRGVKSSAMVLCASNDETVEFVNPPEGSKPGDKIFFEGFDGEPEKVLNPKKKIWETVQPNFSTNENFEVIYKQEGKPDAKLVNKKGELLRNTSIVNANVR